MTSKFITDTLLGIAKTGRTIYPLTKSLSSTALQTTSAFNSQSYRPLVVFGARHDKLWGITINAVKGIVPDSWPRTADRMAMFKNAAGISLAMQQWLLWTSLELEGLGTNRPVQHYKTLIDEKAAVTWDIPASWKLNAQLVVGGYSGEPDEK
ncbi:Nitroreductase-like protein [Dactylonectria estremocensis]|uniref:Nitroreductase-like protein n=1 Tax=Dactylonectria estremocensis TaxID=1079267 RepID=A0A9P9JAE8_9HYPO|nr:Nitroreductase-like protein [Dactylonectria estremocensis]